MRIRIYLELKDINISVNYHSLLQGYLYHSLGYNDASTILHDEGNRLENRPFKLFTFSEIYGEAKYIKETKELKFLENGYFDFTAFNEDFVIKIGEHLILNNKVIIGNKLINVSGYDLLNDDVKTKEDLITLSTTSPIVCYQSDQKKINYYEPNEPEFAFLIINNLEKKYFICYQDNLPNIEILNFINIKKKVIYYRRTFYIAYHCKIDMKFNDERLMHIILTTGLGSKNSMGFGMVNYEKKILPL